MNLIKTGQIQLSGLDCPPDACGTHLEGRCEGCKAWFCMTNIDLVTMQPHLFPTYMQVKENMHCQKQSVSYDLNDIYDEVLAYEVIG